VHRIHGEAGEVIDSVRGTIDAGYDADEDGMILNLFYEEKDDRWLPWDRYPRRVINRLLLGKRSPSGQTRVFLNLCAGLDKLGIRYRVNDYHFIKNNPSELACIIGRPFVLNKIEWKNPILFGVAAYDHPIDDPDLFERLPVKKVLVPGRWYEDMCRPYWPCTQVWPVGIDTDTWAPSREKSADVLLYDKIRWEHDHFASNLIEPIRSLLRKDGRSVLDICYGSYQEDDFRAALSRCRTMIFLCEHESQGIAYQQALSCGVPVLAWDRGGPWQDPSYFPHKIIFKPVTSVPYWDSRCGMKFKDIAAFEGAWGKFWELSEARAFRPREYILETLTLEQRAREYFEIARSVSATNKIEP
jgi:hypothetical protein